jgi:S-adenosylmethionine:tRNA ribosyltransferase-isomerase
MLAVEGSAGNREETTTCYYSFVGQTSDEQAKPLNLALSDFDYDLPPQRIATEPARPRDSSRLLCVDRRNGDLKDSSFRHLASHLARSDVLVVNNTRVLKARVYGILERSGRKIEVLFAKAVSDSTWEVMLRPGKRVRTGDRLLVGEGVRLMVGDRRDHGLRLLEIEPSPSFDADVSELLACHGHIPLPPYIDRANRASDETDYQTMYGTASGAIAAPTAGLHFTPDVMASLEERGIEVCELTLHVGIGTFLPVRTADPAQHHLKPEQYVISAKTADLLNQAQESGRRIIAVGTTTTRTLEYAYRRHGKFVPETGEADLYILPGFRFGVVAGLLTNFHLPRSTLLFLVSAFASRRSVLNAYQHALDSDYRFYSYGDCTLFI